MPFFDTQEGALRKFIIISINKAWNQTKSNKTKQNQNFSINIKKYHNSD